MYQYSNEGYGEYPSRRKDNPNIYRGPLAGANEEDSPVGEEAESQYPPKDGDQYHPTAFETYISQRDAQETGYHDRQNSEETDEVTDTENHAEVAPPHRAPPKPAPKPKPGYFQARINRSNYRNRIFSRQESSASAVPSVESLDHLQAEEDLSPERAAAGAARSTIQQQQQQHHPHLSSSSTYYTPRGGERIPSDQSPYDSAKRTQSPGNVFDQRSQSTTTLDRSTLSARGGVASDQNKGTVYSAKSPTGSILVNRDATNGTLNQSSLSTRSTTSVRDTRNMIVSPSHGVYRVSSRNNVISSRGIYGDAAANRSILSNHSVQSHNGFLNEPNRSILSQAYSIDHSTATRTPTFMQNGSAHPVKETPLDATIRSNITLSRPPSLNASKNNLFSPPNRVLSIVGVDPTQETFRVRESLVTLGLICLVSLVLLVLGTQLIYKLNTTQLNRLQQQAYPPQAKDNNNVLVKGQSYDSVLEVTVAVCSFAIMLDVCCLMVCTLQCYFAVKLLRCSQGDERCYTFLKGCAATRFIAVTGFFISIPALLLALLLFMVMEFRATPAIISVVILSIGLVFIISTVIHSAFYWRQEKTKAEEDIPPNEGRKWLNGESVMSQSELSTLV